eukprot:608657-Pyramimonas_sp.AAC.1
MSKINRVSYGLLSPDQSARALKMHPGMPKSRQLLAVPFIGKDLPSEASEFAHPDIVIGLTIMAYRYEGMRESDFKDLVTSLKDELGQETGPYSKRESWNKYAKWVALNGGKVRG